MGLTVAMLAVEDDAGALGAALPPDLRPAGSAVPLDTVLAGRGDAALGRLEGWEVLLDPELVLPAEPAVVAAATRGRRGYGFLWHSVVDTWGFEAYRDGAPLRRLLHSAGRSVLDDGGPLAEEARLDLAGADGLVELCARLTGIRVTDSATALAPVVPLRPRDGRRLLRRLGGAG